MLWHSLALVKRSARPPPPVARIAHKPDVLGGDPLAHRASRAV